MSILSNFYCPNIILDAEYSFSESGDYKVNGDVSLQKSDPASLILQAPSYSNVTAKTSIRKWCGLSCI